MGNERKGDIVTLKEEIRSMRDRRDVYFKAENIAKKGHVDVFGE